MLAKFRHAIEAEGFMPSAPDKYLLAKDCGLFEQAVTVGKDSAKRIRLKLFLSIRDRFQEPPDYQILLTAFLYRDHVGDLVYGDSWAWNKDEDSQAMLAFREHGLKWFEASSDFTFLIRHFEDELREGVKPAVSAADQLREDLLLRKAPAPSPRRPPVNHLYLSLLYEAIQDRERACTHCRAWLAFIGTRAAYSKDRTRALNQMRELECEIGN